MLVVAGDPDALRPAHPDLDAGQTQTSLYKLPRFRGVVEHRVGETELLLCNGADQHLFFDRHLRTGQPNFRMRPHESKHLLDQVAQRAVEPFHWHAYLPEYKVRVIHQTQPMQLPLALTDLERWFRFGSQVGLRRVHGTLDRTCSAAIKQCGVALGGAGGNPAHGPATQNELAPPDSFTRISERIFHGSQGMNPGGVEQRHATIFGTGEESQFRASQDNAFGTSLG